jgi:hypothetical protein
MGFLPGIINQTVQGIQSGNLFGPLAPPSMPKASGQTISAPGPSGSGTSAAAGRAAAAPPGSGGYAPGQAQKLLT